MGAQRAERERERERGEKVKREGNERIKSLVSLEANPTSSQKSNTLLYEGLGLRAENQSKTQKKNNK